MLSQAQLEKCKQFIYRHGRLLDRKRYAYHFEGGSRQAVLEVLACYQNDDGGFGHGLELDVMCPASTNICTEMAMGYLDELGATQGETADRIEHWIASRHLEGKCLHPKETVLAYPHGGWWEDDSGSSLSLIGMLGKWGRGSDALFEWAEAHYRSREFPADFGVYGYPLYLYLRFAPGAEKFSEDLKRIQEGIPAMLAKEAGHCPLFFCHDRWYSDDIPDATWRAEAAKAVATIQEDGGGSIAYYANLPWWRPVWTLEMLIRLQKQGLLETIGEQDGAGDA